MGWIKFTGISALEGQPIEASWPIERLDRIWVMDATVLYIFFDEPYANNRSTTSGYIKITTPSGKTDELHSELINYVVQANRNNTIDPQITINTSFANVSSIEFVSAA